MVYYTCCLILHKPLSLNAWRLALEAWTLSGPGFPSKNVSVEVSVKVTFTPPPESPPFIPWRWIHPTSRTNVLEIKGGQSQGFFEEMRRNRKMCRFRFSELELSVGADICIDKLLISYWKIFLKRLISSFFDSRNFVHKYKKIIIMECKKAHCIVTSCGRSSLSLPTTVFSWPLRSHWTPRTNREITSLSIRSLDLIELGQGCQVLTFELRIHLDEYLRMNIPNHWDEHARVKKISMWCSIVPVRRY